MEIQLAHYGQLKFDEVQSELIDTPEIQRLRGIKQLGLVSTTYPDGVNTRYAHALGVSYTAGRIADQLKLDSTEKRLVQLAGLLHDIGHTPFSHALEGLLSEDHAEFTKQLVVGAQKLNLPGAGRIHKILYKHGINPVTIGDLITAEYYAKPYLQQIVHGEVDADQMDYLERDPYFTGNPLGKIDIDYLLGTMLIKDGRICFEEKAVETLESFFMARKKMYKTTYVHRVPRIAEAMLLKAVSLSLNDLPDLRSYTDDELFTRLMVQAMHPKSKELAERIKYRNLFKEAYKINSKNASERDMQLAEKLGNASTQNEMERLLLKEIGLKEGDILLDVPIEALVGHRMTNTNIGILLEDGSVTDLAVVYPPILELAKEASADSLFSVYCAEEYKDKVREAVEKYLLQHK